MFLYHQWGKLSITTRAKIAKDFGIQKKRSTHVSDNRIVDDGYLLEDVETALAFDKIRAYVGTEETEPQILWNMFIEKVEYVEPKIVVPTTPPIVETKPIEPIAPIEQKPIEPIIIKRKQGRPRKNEQTQ